MNNKTCQCDCKIFSKCKKDYSLNPRTCICENSKYLKSLADTLVTKCDEIVIAINNLSTTKINTITANIMSSGSTNFHIEKVRNCYILHTKVISDHINFDNYYYWLSLCNINR